MGIITKALRALIVITLFAVSIVGAQSAFAAPANNNTKPGWGNGDKNHVHTGPPGQSVNTSISNSVNITAITSGNATIAVQISTIINQIFGHK